MLGDYKSQRASKSQNWFKSYGNFAEWVDFAVCWSFSCEGSAYAACAAGLLQYADNILYLNYRVSSPFSQSKKNHGVKQKIYCRLILSFLQLLSQVGTFSQWAGLLAGGEVVYPSGIIPSGELSEVRQSTHLMAKKLVSKEIKYDLFCAGGVCVQTGRVGRLDVP